jgi:hypothetical protein
MVHDVIDVQQFRLDAAFEVIMAVRRRARRVHGRKRSWNGIGIRLVSQPWDRWQVDSGLERRDAEQKDGWRCWKGKRVGNSEERGVEAFVANAAFCSNDREQA